MPWTGPVSYTHLDVYKRQVLLIGHYDVVDVKCYGDIAEHAFNADRLAEIFGADSDVLYGRGVMDMKLSLIHI